MSDLEEKLKEELTRVSAAKVELSDDLKARVNSVYDVVMGRRGVKDYLDNDIAPGLAQLRKLYYLVTTSDNTAVGDLLEKRFSRIED